MADGTKITIQDGMVEVESSQGIVVLPVTKFIKYVETVGVQASTPVLPHNCIYYSSYGACRLLVMERPERLTDILYGYRGTQHTYKKIPVPNLVMLVALFFDQGRQDFTVHRCCLFSSSGRVTRLETRLAKFPFGNTDPNQGDICWGANPMPAFKELAGCELLLDRFMDSPTNNDLSVRKYDPESVGEDFYDSDRNEDHYHCERILDYFEEHHTDTFPNDALLSARTLDHWLKEMKRHIVDGWV